MNVNLTKTVHFVIYLVFTYVAIFMEVQANEPMTQNVVVSTVPNSGLNGNQLAHRYCATCHLVPEPVDAPKEYWPVLVEWMGVYLGLADVEFPGIKNGPPPPEFAMNSDYSHLYMALEDEGYMYLHYIFNDLIPPQPLISQHDWLLIRDYYVENARPAKEMIKPVPNHQVLTGFTPVVPELELEPNGLVLSAAVDEKSRRLYVGQAVINDWVKDGRPGYEDYDELIALDIETGERLWETPVRSDPIHLEVIEAGVRVSTHGEMPIVKGAGQGAVTDWSLEDETPRGRTLVSGLHRLIHHHSVDMNSDGLKDLVVNGYGDGLFQNFGGFGEIYFQTPEYASLWQDAPDVPQLERNKPLLPLDNGFRKVQFLDLVGVIDSAIGDFNKDGKPDIVVQVAQGLQQIIVYINRDDETFKRVLVAEYTPSHGGNSLQVGDFDGDGFDDIAALNGDHVGGNHVGPGRAHPRSHHGLRIYRNNGDLTFTDKVIYLMHGAIRSTVYDFDNDGDLDIAMLSLYPDWTWDVPESFVYLENKGELNFVPYSLPKENFAVWSTIVVGDVNGDKKKDVVLGLGNFWSVVPEDWATSHKIMQGRDGSAPTIMYLLNNH